MSQPYSHVASALQSLARTGARKATKFLAADYTVKVTRQRKRDRRETVEVFIVTIGAPNYAERAFIKDAIKAGEPFPVRKARLSYYPQRSA